MMRDKKKKKLKLMGKKKKKRKKIDLRIIYHFPKYLKISKNF